MLIKEVCDACAALQVADFDSQLKSFLGLLPKDVALDAQKVGMRTYRPGARHVIHRKGGEYSVPVLAASSPT